MTEVKKHPDFNEWLLTDAGKKCNDLSSLNEQQYLQNRLFWAFDAGRNCVWDQYTEQKKELASLRSELADKEKEIEVLKRAVKTLSQFLDEKV